MLLLITSAPLANAKANDDRKSKQRKPSWRDGLSPSWRHCIDAELDLDDEKSLKKLAKKLNVKMGEEKISLQIPKLTKDYPNECLEVILDTMLGFSSGTVEVIGGHAYL